MPYGVRLVAIFLALCALTTAQVTVMDTSDKVVDGKRTFTVTLRNDSSKPIVGFLTICSLLDEAGRPFDKAFVGGLTLDANQDRYDPGAKWTLDITAESENHPDTRVGGVRIEIDHVLYRDLTSAGPDTMQRLSRARSEYYGSQMQLARLKRLLKREGIDAVLAVLSKDEPRFSRFSQSTDGGGSESGQLDDLVVVVDVMAGCAALACGGHRRRQHSYRHGPVLSQSAEQQALKAAGQADGQRLTRPVFLSTAKQQTGTEDVQRFEGQPFQFPFQFALHF